MRIALSGLALITALALPVAAHADTVDDFTTTGNGLTLTFSLPSSPTPTGKDPHTDFYIGDISFVENGVSMTASDVYFYTKPVGGGFDLEDADGAVIDGLSFTGPKLFTGPVRNPTFKTGDFKLKSFFNEGCSVPTEDASADAAGGNCKYNLSITPETTVTPEPGSLLLLGTGSLGLLGTLRRRLAR